MIKSKAVQSIILLFCNMFSHRFVQVKNVYSITTCSAGKLQKLIEPAPMKMLLIKQSFDWQRIEQVMQSCWFEHIVFCKEFFIIRNSMTVQTKTI